MEASDLYTVDSHQEGAEIQLISPIDGKKTQCFLKVIGVDSREWRTLEKQGKKKVLLLADKNLTEDEIEEQADEIVADTLAGATIGWRGFNDKKGKEIPFDRSQVRELYIKSPFIADQVNAFIGNRLNFIKG